MGNTHNVRKVNFEDIQCAIKNPDKYILINPLKLSINTILLQSFKSFE